VPLCRHRILPGYSWRLTREDAARSAFDLRSPRSLDLVEPLGLSGWPIVQAGEQLRGHVGTFRGWKLEHLLQERIGVSHGFHFTIPGRVLQTAHDRSESQGVL
jgi:hypothetical protein